MGGQAGDIGGGHEVIAPSEAPNAGSVSNSGNLATKASRSGRSKSLFLRSLAITSLVVLIAVPAVLGGIRLWALHHLRAGRADLERYHHKSALVHFQACLKHRPNDSEALLLAARTQRRLGAYNEAERLLDRYQQAGGNEEDLTLERVLLRADTGDVDGVAAYCRALLERDPEGAPLVLEALTHGYIVRYRWAEAQKCLNQWQQLRPDDTQALLFQGLMDSNRDNPQDALFAFRRALELDPERDDIRFRFAGVLLDLSRASEALPHLEDLHQRQPDSWNIAVDLARCYDQIDRQDEAAALVDNVLSHNPQFGPALFQRGLLAVRQEQWAAAEKWLRQACALEPGDLQAHYQLSQCLQHQGKEAESRAIQAKLEQINADLQRIHDIVSVQMAEAPHDPSLHMEVGVIMLRAGEDAEGLRWLNQALEEDPRHEPTHRALADYYEKHGNAALAARHRDLAKLGASR